MNRLSGVPKATLENWRNGIVRHPRRWQDIVKVALAFELVEEHTNNLIMSGGHITVEELLKLDLVDEDRKLLERFRPSTPQNQIQWDLSLQDRCPSRIFPIPLISCISTPWCKSITYMAESLSVPLSALPERS